MAYRASLWFKGKSEYSSYCIPDSRQLLLDYLYRDIVTMDSIVRPSMYACASNL